MSPHIIGSGLFLVSQGTYGDIMVKELVCRLRVLGSAIYVHDLTGLKPRLENVGLVVIIILLNKDKRSSSS